MATSTVQVRKHRAGAGQGTELRAEKLVCGLGVQGDVSTASGGRWPWAPCLSERDMMDLWIPAGADRAEQPTSCSWALLLSIARSVSALMGELKRLRACQQRASENMI